jgi:ABC-type transporter Mla subunit MlaD
MPNPSPYVYIDLEEVATRNESARHTIAGFSIAMPTLAEIWQYLDDALTDVPTLSAEIDRLSSELRNARLDRANLIAAARATIAAHRDGEPDPLAYLRDELDALTSLSRDARGRA